MTASESPAGWLPPPGWLSPARWLARTWPAQSRPAGTMLANPLTGRPEDDAATGDLPAISGDEAAAGPGAGQAGQLAGIPGTEHGGESGGRETGGGEDDGGRNRQDDGDAGSLAPRGITLAARLAAVGRMTAAAAARSGPGGFSPELVRDAEGLLARAGERLQLSADHTVVVLAGGTGSGKSSLFNRLAGADLSPPGVTRPMTRYQHACVWGTDGAGPLLDWLGVPTRYRYARSSALDEGERSLAGLVLLDLPDHDSVLAAPSRQGHQLIQLADLMIWVLDPQKYADAAVHKRYLVPMAGHSSVIAVVLNQADLLTGEEAEDCASDLRRLLESEGLPDARVLLTSAATGAGLDELRRLLTGTVSARQAATERISADVDAVAARFRPYAGETAPEVAADELNQALAVSAGVAGLGRALENARRLRAVDYVGWPVAWAYSRLTGGHPLRKVRLTGLWEELRLVRSGPAAAQQPAIDKALTALADRTSAGLPDPWPATVREAARLQAGDIPGALGTAIAESLPPEDRVMIWWRVVAAWQGLLLGCVVTAAAWLALLLAFGVFHAARQVPAIFTEVALLPWAGAMMIAFLLLGWLTATACMSLVVRSAARERSGAEASMRAGVDQVAQRMVLAPLEHELAEYARFRENLSVALASR